MYCKNCGKELPEDSKFCPFCGTAQYVGGDVTNINNQPPHLVQVEFEKKKISEDQVRKVILKIIKEIFVLIICVGVAFLIAFIMEKLVFYILDNHFHHTFEFIEDEFSIRNRFIDHPMTLAEWMGKVRTFQAEYLSSIVFWVLLIGLPAVRYMIILIKWLRKGSQENASSTSND